jgi:OOP family OmpA-OmpF porin
MKKIIIVISVALLSYVVFSVSALAADQGAYVAAGQGQAIYSNAEGGPDGTTAFANPPAITIGGGYHFSQYVGVEAGYSVIGNSKINTTFAYLGTATETLKASALQVVAVGTFPINDKFEFFGKLGVANTKIEYTVTTDWGYSSSDSATKANVMYGIGGQFNINRHFGIRAQYEDFGKVQFSGAGAPNVGLTIFSVGGVYNF